MALNWSKVWTSDFIILPSILFNRARDLCLLLASARQTHVTDPYHARECKRNVNSLKNRDRLADSEGIAWE